MIWILDDWGFSFLSSKQTNSEGGLHNWHYYWKMTLIISSFAEENCDKSNDMGTEQKITQNKKFSRIFSLHTGILWKCMLSVNQLKVSNTLYLPQTVGVKYSKLYTDKLSSNHYSKICTNN